MKEIENNAVEWKEVWDREWLKGMSAFATFDGGTYLIGVKDNGVPVGIKNPRDEMKSISDTIRNVLGISPDIECIDMDGKDIIRIIIHHSQMPVDCNGRFYKRIGNTVHELRGNELIRLLLERNNMTWTDKEIKNYKEEDVSTEALEYVIEKGQERGNVPKNAKHDLPTILDNFNLRGSDGLITIAGVALFSKKPDKYAPGTYVKIGKFDDHNELVGEDIIDGPLILQPETAVEVLFMKYIRNRYTYGDLFRDVKFEYSRRALREAVLNACIHKDYLRGNPVFIKVREDSIEIFNEGSLPDSWTYDDFVNENHTSHPPNRKIANVFHDIGLIERWGNGIRLMIEECEAEGSKPPEFIINRQGIKVKFFNILTAEEPAPVVHDEKLSDNENKVLNSIIKGSKNYSDICDDTGLGRSTVANTISSLMKKDLISRVGSTKKGFWTVNKNTENK